jgi:hypothetical protein
MRFTFHSLFAILSLSASVLVFGQAPQPAPNSDAIYQQIRGIHIGDEAVTVSNYDLKRDAATFHLRAGKVCFLTAVQGKVVGAVFEGEGAMSLTPPLPAEANMLKLLTKEDTFNETFGKMMLWFTDSTYDELKKANPSTAGGCDPGPLQDSQNALRKKVNYNLAGRILEDVLSPEPGGLFVAFVHGQRYEDKMVFSIDPHGSPNVEPEEIELSTYDENKAGIWTAFHLSGEYAKGVASGAERNAAIHIEHQQLDTTIEKNANLIGKATTTFVAQTNGVRVVPFNLFGSLRVQSVTANGVPLAFIQEDKKDDPDFFVILPTPLAKGGEYTITTNYSGKEAVSNEGGGNYFPIARDNWYPNSVGNALGEYSTYDLEFRIPKGMKIAAAAANLVSEDNNGSQNITQWKSEGAQTVAGFQFGRFKMQEAKLTNPDYLVQSYANEEPPDAIKGLLHAVNNELPTEGLMDSRSSDVALGTMSTLPLIKKSLAEGQLAIGLYTQYFGPIPFKRLAITQQTSCSFGQSWPSLVWLPMCSFYDATIRHQLGLDDDRGYWKSVTPHEVAHQWWGHEVGFNSYRDQWMSEGFADMSAGLFLQLVEKNPKKFIQFWNDQRELMLEKNRMGYRAIDVGPVTMGYRLNNSRVGFDITRRIIYPKGAYILHMVRMMMWSGKTGDQNFRDTMQDFVRTYAGKTATTEDFKAVLEKHMTPDMIAMAGGKNSMDWFFNEYVYGTDLPAYSFEPSFKNGSDGATIFSFKLTQSGVGGNFRMMVPIYLELEDGRTAMLGRVRMTGDTTVSQEVPLGNTKVKSATINYFDDVLASPN